MGFVSKILLHCGCGGARLPEWLKACREVRVDIDETCGPDVVSDMTALGVAGPFDAVYCSHALEHLHQEAGGKALAEFYRVLCEGGVAIVFVPDLEDVKPTEDVLFTAPAGPITGLDLIYGYRKMTQEKPHMKHLTGFVKETLRKAVMGAGFSRVEVNRIGNYELMGVGIK